MGYAGPAAIFAAESFWVSPIPVAITDSASSARTKTMPAAHAYLSHELVVRVARCGAHGNPQKFVRRPRSQPNRSRDHVQVTVVRIRRAEEVHDLAEAAVDEHRRVALELVPGADVEHVGATAVPGALTKGDVDIAVRVGKPQFSAAVDALSSRYAIHQPHNWTPTLASFTEPDPGELPVGIQLVVAGLGRRQVLRPVSRRAHQQPRAADGIQRAEAPP